MTDESKNLNDLRSLEDNDNKELTRVEKAAVVLLSIGQKAASVVMKKFSREEVLLLSETMARLQGVKVLQASEAMDRFFDDYREQSGINGGSRAYLQGILEGALGREIAKSVMNSIYGDEIRYRMTKLQWVDSRQLITLIEHEHLQLQAVFLAFLPPDVASTILSEFPIEQQQDILYRITRLDDVNKDVIEELDRLIDRGISLLSEHGSSIQGIKQVANIVNRIKDNQGEILAQLAKRDEKIAEELQDEMYEFFILSRQNDLTLQAIINEIPLDDWAVALKGTEPVLREKINNALPKRQAQELQVVSMRLGPVPISRIEQVRKNIMSIVRELAEDGEIEIQLFSEKTMD